MGFGSRPTVTDPEKGTIYKLDGAAAQNLDAFKVGLNYLTVLIRGIAEEKCALPKNEGVLFFIILNLVSMVTILYLDDAFRSSLLVYYESSLFDIFKGGVYYLLLGHQDRSVIVDEVSNILCACCHCNQVFEGTVDFGATKTRTGHLVYRADVIEDRRLLGFMQQVLLHVIKSLYAQLVEMRPNGESFSFSRLIHSTVFISYFKLFS